MAYTNAGPNHGTSLAACKSILNLSAQVNNARNVNGNVTAMS